MVKDFSLVHELMDKLGRTFNSITNKTVVNVEMSAEDFVEFSNSFFKGLSVIDAGTGNSRPFTGGDVLNILKIRFPLGAELHANITPSPEKTMSERKQELENISMHADAIAEAEDMFRQWEAAQLNPRLQTLKSLLNLKQVPVLVISKPRRAVINVFDEKTAYTSEDYRKIKNDHYLKLVNEFSYGKCVVEGDNYVDQDNRESTDGGMKLGIDSQYFYVAFNNAFESGDIIETRIKNAPKLFVSKVDRCTNQKGKTYYKHEVQIVDINKGSFMPYKFVAPGNEYFKTPKVN